MEFQPDQVYHIYNRGNNRQQIFYSKSNYLFFLEKLKRHLLPYCDLLAWCLMTNHFHFLVYARAEGCGKKVIGRDAQVLAYYIGIILSSYTQSVNRQLNRTGSLFQLKTKAKILGDETSIVNCMHYIHQNPLKAKLVSRLEDWEFSSFRDYIGQRNGSLCNQELLFDLTGYNKTDFFDDSYNAIVDFDDFL